uniref:Methylosome subunit pICln n=1 Tax=Chromera velia CCMP2878 TaxID=1169474 RepID=A0A0G4G8X1_9ALVE|eukprot:Cvel_4375.t1-p1 / transcript=Cvel_4375.t1 / gene=Cvel_4375 / organism=Chromera_velia_CCMP2878 / gene_product=Chloride conductance regulatory protein ICln, putative / transcript_product=Chloride conductance regulatory protein ICln, putative / location=Cvel_scaffold189:107920-110587(+) / protein_length=282 / sequence_SO=supercontig / SO=protein_coding / is_pseudo=false
MPIQKGLCLEASGLPSLGEDERVYASEDAVSAVTGETDQGRGKLVLTTRRLVWISEVDSGTRSFAIDLVDLVLHAISNDGSAHPRPCVYCQLKGETKRDPDAEEQEDTEEETEDEIEIPELRLVPEEHSPTKLHEIFQRLCEVVAMNPDPDDEDEDEDGEEGRGEFGDELIRAMMNGGIPPELEAEAAGEGEEDEDEDEELGPESAETAANSVDENVGASSGGRGASGVGTVLFMNSSAASGGVPSGSLGGDVPMHEENLQSQPDGRGEPAAAAADEDEEMN